MKFDEVLTFRVKNIYISLNPPVESKFQGQIVFFSSSTGPKSAVRVCDENGLTAKQFLFPGTEDVQDEHFIQHEVSFS